MKTNNQVSDILEKLRALYSHTESSFSNGTASREVILDAGICMLITSISDTDPSCDISVVLTGDQSDIPISEIQDYCGSSVVVAAHVPRTKKSFFAHDLVDLVSSGYAYCTPEKYYLYEIDFLSSDMSSNKAHDRYIQVLHLIQQICQTASFDHKEESFEGLASLLFLTPKKRLELPLEYNINLIKIDSDEILKCADLISSTFSDTLHAEEKRMLFKTTLVDYLYLRTEDQRLNYLANNIKEFCKKFKDNYELFISEFSFESEIERVHQERRDFSSRLNDLLTGIQTKLLAIPLAFLISGSQLKPIDSFTTGVSNVFVVMSIFIFVLIIMILISTQLSLLKAVKNEFSAKKIWLLQNLPISSEELSEEFDSLEIMSSNIEKNLKIIGFFAALSLVFAVFLCSYYSFAM